MSLARDTSRCRSKDLSLDEHVERLARLGRGVFDSYALAASA
jgi:hypothetical protein